LEILIGVLVLLGLLSALSFSLTLSCSAPSLRAFVKVVAQLIISFLVVGLDAEQGEDLVESAGEFLGGLFDVRPAGES
jgi:hypothetical protein